MGYAWMTKKLLITGEPMSGSSFSTEGQPSMVWPFLKVKVMRPSA